MDPLKRIGFSKGLQFFLREAINYSSSFSEGMSLGILLPELRLRFAPNSELLMSWWEDVDYGPKYELQRAVKKEKKAADKNTKDEEFGSWDPYSKVKPYLQLKVFIGLYIPFLAWVAYNHLAGSWPGSGGPIALALFAAIVGVPIYHIAAPLWLLQPGYSHPGWVNLECPECGHIGKPGQDAKGYAENFGQFLWDRVMFAKCPKCQLKFEIANMSQFWWPYVDEPHPGKKYGDSSKIRVKPKVPFRFGSFILMKKEGFSSSHYELIKVVPATAILLGVPWYFGKLDLIFLVLVITVCFNLFVWRHEAFVGFREAVIKQLKEMGILRKNYVMRWWEELIINFIFILITIPLLWVAGNIDVVW